MTDDGWALAPDEKGDRAELSAIHRPNHQTTPVSTQASTLSSHCSSTSTVPFAAGCRVEEIVRTRTLLFRSSDGDVSTEINHGQRPLVRNAKPAIMIIHLFHTYVRAHIDRPANRRRKRIFEIAKPRHTTLSPSESERHEAGEEEVKSASICCSRPVTLEISTTGLAGGRALQDPDVCKWKYLECITQCPALRVGGVTMYVHDTYLHGLRC